MTTEERYEEARRFLEAARSIGERTRDAEAQKCWTYLLQHVAFGEPRHTLLDGKVQFDMFRPEALGTFIQSEPLALVALRPDDVSIHPRLTLASWQGAAYDDGLHGILISGDDLETAFMLGCKLLHEVLHGLRALADGRAGQPQAHRQTPEERLREETCVRRMDARLWLERGGSVYQDILQRAVYRIRKNARWGAGTVELPMIRENAWLDAFDTLFGTAPDERARNRRAGSFLVHAYFQFIEEERFPDAHTFYAEVIRAVYANASIPV